MVQRAHGRRLNPQQFCHFCHLHLLHVEHPDHHGLAVGQEAVGDLDPCRFLGFDRGKVFGHLVQTTLFGPLFAQVIDRRGGGDNGQEGRQLGTLGIEGAQQLEVVAAELHENLLHHVLGLVQITGRGELAADGCIDHGRMVRDEAIPGAFVALQ